MENKKKSKSVKKGRNSVSKKPMDTNIGNVESVNIESATIDESR